MNALPGGDDRPSRFGFLLLDNFTLISLSSAIEPLRMANRISKSEHFHWKTIGVCGEDVVASDNVRIRVDCNIEDDKALQGIEVLIVCGGVRVHENITKPVVRFLRIAHQNGLALGAICTGTQVLAEAGLLDGYRCSIHWENLNKVADAYPGINVRRSLFTIDRNRFTSSGGTAPIDLMLHIINEQLGSEISVAVAEQFICDRIRRGDDEQKIPLKHIVGNQSGKLVVAVELMEANLREPISQEDLAAYVGLSRRQLQRLFHKYLMCAPSRYYLKLRLQRARELLQQTGMSILEVTAESGFVSTSHFSKSYKENFGYSPSLERQRGQSPSS